MADQAPAQRPAWRAPVAVVVCVALELAIATSPLGSGARTAGLIALAAVAVALSLRQTLGGLVGARALRLAVMGPIAFSIVLAVVLMLDAQLRGGNVLR